MAAGEGTDVAPVQWSFWTVKNKEDLIQFGSFILTSCSLKLNTDASRISTGKLLNFLLIDNLKSTETKINTISPMFIILFL